MMKAFRDDFGMMFFHSNSSEGSGTQCKQVEPQAPRNSNPTVRTVCKIYFKELYENGYKTKKKIVN